MRETLQRRLLASHAPVHDVVGGAIRAQETLDEPDVEAEWRAYEQRATTEGEEIYLSRVSVLIERMRFVVPCKDAAGAEESFPTGVD